MTEAERLIAEKNGTLARVYGQEVNKLIRMRYSLSDELAILRKRIEKPEEFEAYNVFVEECKAKAKVEIYGEASG